VTILEVIQRGTEFLEKKGVGSPRLQVELLLAHLLSIPRMKLYLSFDRSLTDEQVAASRALVQRRGLREPLQYIVGSVSFCGLELAVKPGVLIPRPETELLAERAWKHLASLPSPATALDFGTGSGCLAIALAHQAAQASVHALDRSPEALEMARQNAARHNLGDRIQFHSSDGFAQLPPALRFDLIVSNPPYIPSAEIETLDPEIRDHEPRGALDGGPDGMDFYRRFATEARAFLQPQGKLMTELAADSAEGARQAFENEKWIVEAIEPDYNQHPRILIARPA